MSPTILVADDSTAIQKVIKIACASLDIDLFTANSYFEAKSLFETKEPFLVLVDINLPGLDDVAKLNDYLIDHPESKIVFLVGSYDDFDERNLAHIPFSFEILKKPFATHDLLLKIKNLLEIDESPQPSPQLRDDDEDVGSIDIDITQKGRPAFEPPPPNISPPSRIPEINLDQPAAAFISPEAQSISKSELLSIIEPLVRQQVQSAARMIIEEYCRNNYKEIARDILSQEIKRLSEEKLRLQNDS